MKCTTTEVHGEKEINECINEDRQKAFHFHPDSKNGKIARTELFNPCLTMKCFHITNTCSTASEKKEEQKSHEKFALRK